MQSSNSNFIGKLIPLVPRNGKSHVETVSLPEHKEIRCPICGVDVVGPTDVCGPPYCAHIQFIYSNGQALGYTAPEIEEMLSSKQLTSKKNTSMPGKSLRHISIPMG